MLVNCLYQTISDPPNCFYLKIYTMSVMLIYSFLFITQALNFIKYSVNCHNNSLFNKQLISSGISLCCHGIWSFFQSFLKPSLLSLLSPLINGHSPKSDISFTLFSITFFCYKYLQAESSFLSRSIPFDQFLSTLQCPQPLIKITTVRLIINYNCSASGLGFLLTSSSLIN